MQEYKSIVMMGASGAVGGNTLVELAVSLPTTKDILKTPPKNQQYIPYA